MIPYVYAPVLEIGGLRLPTFGLLVSIGILVAHLTLVSRAGRLGLKRAWAAEMSLAMVVGGAAGAVLFKLLYRPDLLAAGLAAALANLPGISSFGGVIGGLGAGWLYLRVARGLAGGAALAYLDAAAFAFPFGWIFGRAGCALMHDHPGIRGQGWLTVAYPDGARYDLGLLEMLFMIAVAAAFVWLAQRHREPGFFLAVLLPLYGAFRIALDRFHVDPPRYAGVSVDTWAGAALALAGVLLFRRAVRLSYN